MASGLPVQRLTDDALWARVAGQARCADSGLDPDQWYPVSIEPARARHEATAAIAVCAACPVRAQCLELSLRPLPGRHAALSSPTKSRASIGARDELGEKEQ